MTQPAGRHAPLTNQNTGADGGCEMDASPTPHHSQKGVTMDMTPIPVDQRDYGLTGRDGRHAVEIGLASAEWYHSDVPRKVMKDLMQRSDGPALRDTALWFALLFGTAAGGIWFWGSWVAVPFFIVYGVLYGSSCDSRWHECGHGTAFRTPWMNDRVYQIASFMVMRNPVTWHWSHARHHTDTYIVGRDAEIVWMRPPKTLPPTARPYRDAFHNLDIARAAE